jgi:hypothetical protein
MEKKMPLTICNNSSVNLNFIMHVLNLYQKEKILSNDIFLSIDELENNIRTIWNNIVGNFQLIPGETANSSFVKYDRELFLQKDLYKALFKSTELGYNTFLNTWNDYIKNWYSEKLHVISNKTDDNIPIIYNLVIDKLSQMNVEASGDFGIQIIFGQVPDGCLRNGSIFTIESVDNLTDKIKLNDVSERLFNLVCLNMEQ